MQHHTIIGLPGAGKTTFLAALWHLLTAGEVESRLTLDRLVGNHEYLNRIAEAWQRCERVPRTSTAAEATVSIHVRDRVSNHSFILAFPDLSGETFQSQFASRACTPEYLRGFEEDGGILLFVTADRPAEGLTILDLGPALEGAPVQERLGESHEWSHALVPEQVRLVDLLQFIQRRPFRRKTRRLAVVISAWDVVAQPRPEPHVWLERELPLLSQFLAANDSSFDVRSYGVSAQGGDVASEDRVRLLGLVPSRRIQCEGLRVSQHDITGPISWATTDG